MRFERVACLEAVDKVCHTYLQPMLSNPPGDGQTQNVLSWKELLSFDWDHSFAKQCWGSVWKAVVGSALALGIGVVILFISLLAVNPVQGQSAVPTPVATNGAQMVEVQYYLPYPGILPDSPLYKVKALRDKIWLLIPADGEKKARKELLMADKRINAALVLVEGGKSELGVSTATKAEKYLQSSVQRTVEEQQKGKDVKSLLLSLEKATAKHALTIEKMILETEEGDKKVLETTLSGTKSLQEKVSQALRENK